MDGRRTWSANLGLPTAEGTWTYALVLEALAQRSRQGLAVARVAEDWHGQPGQVIVEFDNKDWHVTFAVDDRRRVDPAVVIEVNRLLDPDGPRFWSWIQEGRSWL
jgi:hypothetical protein